MLAKWLKTELFLKICVWQVKHTLDNWDIINTWFIRKWCKQLMVFLHTNTQNLESSNMPAATCTEMSIQYFAI